MNSSESTTKLLFICSQNRLRRKFPEAVQGKRIVCLQIPDDYEYMQPELIDELRAKLDRFIVVPGSTP